MVNQGRFQCYLLLRLREMAGCSLYLLACVMGWCACHRLRLGARRDVPAGFQGESPRLQGGDKIVIVSSALSAASQCGRLTKDDQNPTVD